MISKTTDLEPYRHPGVYVLGIGVQYPPHSIEPKDLTTLARRFYPSSPALEKVLTINEYTGIDARSSIGTIDHPLVNGEQPPSITQLSEIFLEHGVALSVAACRQALDQWGGDLKDITAMVCTTCTHSANPGFDHFVVKELGLNPNVEKVLLHGIGCSGGMAAIRTAANLALGSSFRRKPARILVLACEISTTFVRSELESVCQDQEVRIGLTLFSDCASAMVIANEFSDMADERPLVELLGWEHEIIKDSEKDLGFDVNPLGWKVVLSQRVPKLTIGALPGIFDRLVRSIPGIPTSASEYDFALHPGGATILSGCQKAMNLTEHQLRASFEVYISHGNSSSATFKSVMKRLLEGPTTEHIFGCAFGPGIAVEAMVFKRIQRDPLSGSASPAETLVAEDITAEYGLVAEEVD